MASRARQVMPAWVHYSQDKQLFIINQGVRSGFLLALLYGYTAAMAASRLFDVLCVALQLEAHLSPPLFLYKSVKRKQLVFHTTAQAQTKTTKTQIMCTL